MLPRDRLSQQDLERTGWFTPFHSEMYLRLCFIGISTCRFLAWEGFSISTVAGHIGGPRHYGLRNLAKLMIDGGPIPLVTKEMLRDIANQDFDFHKDWTRDEAVRSLEKNGPETVRFIESLTDENLKAEGYLESFGGNLTVDQLIDWIMIGTSVEHLENMKRAV